MFTSLQPRAILLSAFWPLRTCTDLAHLQLAGIQPLSLGLITNRGHDHVKVILIAHGDHVAIGRIVVPDLDLEPAAKAKLRLDAAHQVGEFNGHAHHDVAHIAGVHLDTYFRWYDALGCASS